MPHSFVQAGCKSMCGIVCVWGDHRLSPDVPGSACSSCASINMLYERWAQCGRRDGACCRTYKLGAPLVGGDFWRTVPFKQGPAAMQGPWGSAAACAKAWCGCLSLSRVAAIVLLHKCCSSRLLCGCVCWQGMCSSVHVDYLQSYVCGLKQQRVSCSAACLGSGLCIAGCRKPAQTQ
jgi:hypothetical protein